MNKKSTQNYFSVARYLLTKADVTLSGSIRREKTATPCWIHGVASVHSDMRTNGAPGLKTSGTAEASTAREAVLS